MFGDEGCDSDDDIWGHSVRGRSRSRSRRAEVNELWKRPATTPQSVPVSSTDDVIARASVIATQIGAQLPVTWVRHVENVTQKARSKLGRQMRPLMHDSMYSGTGSQAMVFRLTGVAHVDSHGAERKVHARSFARLQGLEPQVYYKSVEQMVKEARAPEDDGYVRSDLFTAGFPCQPWSYMKRSLTDPTAHDGYIEFMRTLQYIRKTLPRLCLLENIIAFCNHQSGLAVLQSELGHMYHIQVFYLNLNVWIDVKRPRAFIGCLHKGVGELSDLASAAGWVHLIEDAISSRDTLEQHLFVVGSDRWKSKVLLDLSSSEYGPRQNQKDPAWERKAKAVRDALAAHGRGWAIDARPLATARLRGMSGTDRQRSLLESVLLMRCHVLDLDPTVTSQCDAAKRGLKWDISQNASMSDIGSLRTTEISCPCTGAILYSFEFDRVVHPEELASAMGWIELRPMPSLTRHELMDLLGESQALQPLGAITWALLLGVSHRMLGLWACSE